MSESKLNSLLSQPRPIPSILATVSGYSPDGNTLIVTMPGREKPVRVTLGPAHNEEAALKRRKISEISDKNHHRYIEPGSTVRLDYVSGDRETGYQATYIKALAPASKPECAAITAIGRVLPIPANGNNATIDLLDEPSSVSIASAKQCWDAINHLGSTDSPTLDVSKFAGQRALYFTDDARTPILRIVVNNILVAEPSYDSPAEYRRPNRKELAEQLFNNERVKKLMGIFQEHPDFKLTVTPGWRMVVAARTANEKEFAAALRACTSTFEIGTAKPQKVEQIGFRPLNIGTYNGFVTSVKAGSNTLPRLNVLPESKAASIRKHGFTAQVQSDVKEQALQSSKAAAEALKTAATVTAQAPATPSDPPIPDNAYLSDDYSFEADVDYAPTAEELEYFDQQYGAEPDPKTSQTLDSNAPRQMTYGDLEDTPYQPQNNPAGEQPAAKTSDGRLLQQEQPRDDGASMITEFNDDLDSLFGDSPTVSTGLSHG